MIDIAGVVTGIDVEAESQFYFFTDYIVEGAATDIKNVSNSIILGKGLAEKLLITRGDVVQIITTKGERFPLKVVGFYQSGIKELDKVQSFVSISTVQKLLGKPSSYLTDIQIKLTDKNIAPDVAKERARCFKPRQWHAHIGERKLVFEEQRAARQPQLDAGQRLPDRACILVLIGPVFLARHLNLGVWECHARAQPYVGRQPRRQWGKPDEAVQRQHVVAVAEFHVLEQFADARLGGCRVAAEEAFQENLLLGLRDRLGVGEIDHHTARIAGQPARFDADAFQHFDQADNFFNTGDVF